VLVFMVLGLGACAVTSNNIKSDLYEEYAKNQQLEELKKISAFRFQGWSALDDEHLIISVSLHKSYLVTLDHRCDGLSYATSIKVNQYMSSSLSSRFDSISVPKSMGPKCTFKSIHKLTKEQAKEIQKLDDKK